MNDFEPRQILLMKNFIKDYRKDKIDINELIFNLEALGKFFEETDTKWYEKFLIFWGTLEITNSVRIFNNLATFSQEEEKDINDAIENLMTLVIEKARNIPEDFLLWSDVNLDS
jgi:hypothetical protein